MAHLLGRKAKPNIHMNAKQLQEDLADTGVVVHRSTVQHRCTNRVYLEESSEGNLTCDLIHKSQLLNFAKQHLDKPESFVKQVLLERCN